MNIHPQILIVEDDAILAIELQETLTQLGYQVIGLAATGKAAVKSALAQKPDVILMDIRLRGAMTGIQAVEQIHKQLDIPIVYLTAFADEALLQQAKITDAYAYLVKPVRERELRAGLEMALYKHAAEQRLQHLNQILRAVRDVNQLITREHDAQRLMDEACQILLRAHGYRFVWIGESVGNLLKPLAHAGDGQTLLAHIVASATPEQGQKLPGVEASRTRRVTVCHDMLHDERYAPWREEVEKAHFSSTVAVPIFHEESLFGVLSVYSDQTNIFGAEEIDLLLEMAGDIAFGLKAIAGEAERQRAEDELRESRALLFNAFNNSPLLMTISDLSTGKYLEVNDSFCRISEFSREEAVGRTSVEIGWLGEEERTQLVRELQQHGKITGLELTLRSKSGRTVICRYSGDIIQTAQGDKLFSTAEDITESKHSEVALRESDARFRAVVENSNDGILFGDANAVIHYRSPSYNRINGYTDEERVGHSGFETVHPDDAADLRIWWVKMLESPGISYKTEYRIRHKDGNWRWIETSGQNLLGNPDVHSVVVTSRDITERKQAEEALHESESRFRAFVEQAPVAIGVFNLNGIGLYANQKYIETLGLKGGEEFAGRPAFEYFAPQFREESKERTRRRLLGLPVPAVYESIALRADGLEFPVQLAVAPIQLADETVSIAFLTDITERKQAEEETALKNKQLTTLNQLGQALNSLAPLPEILERISDLIGQVFDNQNLYVALYDEATDYVSFPIFRENGERKNPTAGRPAGNGLTEFVIRTQAPALISENIEEVLTERGIAHIGATSQCYLGVPILVNERVIGVIAVQDYERSHVYNANHVELLSTIASQAAIAIENARLYETVQQELAERKRVEVALQQQNQLLLALQNTTLELVSQLDLKTLLENIVKRACALVGTSAGLLDLVDPATNQLMPQIGVGALKESLHLPPAEPGEGLVGTVWQTAEILVVPDYDQWAGRLDKFSHSTLGSVIGVPLLSDGRVLGVLATGSAYGVAYHFDPAAIEILNQFARLATVAVENARLFANLQTELTERKRAEQSLQESEARFRAVVQTANDAIISADMHGAIISWNMAAENIFGFSADEALGKPVDRIVPQKFNAQHRHGMEHALVSNERQIIGKTVEGVGLTKDGREFPIEMSLAEWKTQTGAFFTAIIRNISERKQRETELQAIATLSTALRTAQTRAEMLPVIVKQLVALLNCETVSIEIIEPLTGDAVTEVAHGVWESLIGKRKKSGTGVNAIISQTRQPYTTNDLNNDPNLVYPKWTHEGLCGGIGAPLIAQDKMIGFVSMGRKTKISESDVRLFASVADIAANAIHRATLHEQTQKDAADLAMAYDSTLEGWAHALELRDQETEGHTRRVTQMTVDLARAMGIGEDELEHIRRGALLHDIGKMGIPDSILRKPGKLDEHEWEIMRQHPEYAYKLLEPIEYLHPVLDIPYCHHERWDGTGYPRHLKGEQIPLVARIFAIVDVWDALRSDRPYRAAWPKDKALAHIKEQEGRHFDPAVVDMFLKTV